MSDTAIKTALATLDSLEARLQKVHWYLSGSEEVEDTLKQVAAQGRDDTVQARLARLENNLGKLSSRSPVVRDLLKLHASHPDFFHPTTTDVPTTLSTPEILAIVNSCAPSYQTTASRLNAIKDLPIPPAAASASLVALQPRLSKLEHLQNEQARDMAGLRKRSARAIQRWYELGVLGESDCWTEWEGRVVEVEKRVRREEGRMAKETEEDEAYGD
ncbi:hypothetical protein HO133_009588 [Letharia lupina]|uniref:Nuclear distribution protein RO10 n=1 Tax=Letharia lupina TaxID=560253 RepID=A0A8H6FF51_9LECA|nr:uncharacterized protein HO133_009588 [Letharia lupina]KAF6225588.1 hypothetical protein HO133_009588 [Letharia lupina]